MKKYFIITILLLSILIIGPAYSENTKEKSSKPMPLLKSVPDDKLIKPGKGLGKTYFGDSLKNVETIYGRGELVPQETNGFSKVNILSLIYKKKGLEFKFINGLLAVIIVKKSGYATKTGVQIGGDVGDLIREFGTDYKIQKSLLENDGHDKSKYNIYYNTILGQIDGKIIKEIQIRTNKKIKPRRRR